MIFNETNIFLKHYLPPKEVYDYLDLNIEYLNPSHHDLIKLFEKDLIKFNQNNKVSDLESILNILKKN